MFSFFPPPGVIPLPLMVLTFLCLVPTASDIQIVANFENKSESENSPSNNPADGDIQLVREAKKNVPEPQDYSYSERDVILYNLSIGATEQELHWTFENHEEFSALPSFGVIPQFLASSGIPLDFLPNFNPVRNPCTWRPAVSVHVSVLADPPSSRLQGQTVTRGGIVDIASHQRQTPVIQSICCSIGVLWTRDDQTTVKV